MEQRAQCMVFVCPYVPYVIRHCLPGVAFHVNDYVVWGGIALCVCVLFFMPFFRKATYGISLVVFWCFSIAAYSWLKGTKWFFFNIMYDLTRKQPAMVQHCIDAKRLHSKQWSEVVTLDVISWNPAYEHIITGMLKSITCSNNLSLMGVSVCSYATTSIDGIQNWRPYIHSQISIPLEPAIGMHKVLPLLRHIHFDLIYLFLSWK